MTVTPFRYSSFAFVFARLAEDIAGGLKTELSVMSPEFKSQG